MSARRAPSNWGTVGAALNGHILTATQKLADNNKSNDARAIAVTVISPNLHVGNLDGIAAVSGDIWSATVQITVHDSRHNPVNGATVRGNWNGSGPVGECITGGDGMCTVLLSSIPIATRMAGFGVTSLTPGLRVQASQP